MTLLARRYASALFAAASAAGGAAVVDQVEGDLGLLHGAAADPAVRALITSPDLSSQERAGLLHKLGTGRHALVQNLLRVLQRRHRLPVLFDLHGEFRALRMQSRGEVEAVAEVARPLPAAEADRLAALAARLSGRKVELKVEVVPSLIAGVRLRVGNLSFDASVQSALAQLEQRMLQAAI